LVFTLTIASGVAGLVLLLVWMSDFIPVTGIMIVASFGGETTALQ
jgi:hypothetical protein